MFGFSFNLIFVYFHFPKFVFATKHPLIEVTSKQVNLSIKILVPCWESENPDFVAARQGETGFSRRVSLKPKIHSEGLVKAGPKIAHGGSR